MISPDHTFFRVYIINLIPTISYQLYKHSSIVIK